jgi:hypothetical protein
MSDLIGGQAGGYEHPLAIAFLLLLGQFDRRRLL